MKKLFVTLLFLTALAPLCAFEDRLYIDSSELNMQDDRFRIHMGNNTWIETTSVVRDDTGLYTLESNIVKAIKDSKVTYHNAWKCPYCFNWWPMGKGCQNPQCPSKFPSACVKA